ncbi:hypothetical protein, partial [Bifidobacterium sp. SO1]|uniref:hypothetical protein n=1 Tax=Bifidobacterium sp. SO1 TaxID=2809029 RepID=UPI001BDC1302
MIQPKPYAVRFDISDRLWMTTVDEDTIEQRKRRRGRLRAQARNVWRQARQAGAQPVTRYMMLVTVGGRRESPILAAETLKPLIDAGTDEHLWPDDDPYHRLMTCYLRDPRPLAGGKALIHIWIIPTNAGENPIRRLLSRTPNATGTLASVTFDDDTWLTSNMRLDHRERLHRQERIIHASRDSWRASPGSDCAVICQVAYPDHRPEYKGDPDNTAETATAMWGAGVMKGLLPATPGLFAFTLAPGE